MMRMTLISFVLIPGIFAVSPVLSKDVQSDSERRLFDAGEDVNSTMTIADATINRFLLQVRKVNRGGEKNSRITVKARDASLKDVLEELGHKLGIEVVTQISPQEKVTVEFSNLSLREALKKLSSRYVYQTDSSHEGETITKIWVLPEGREAKSSPAIKADSDKPAQPEPFKFEFDPTEFVRRAQD